MRVLHVLAGDNYTEGMAYKDNFLAAENKAAGHDALIVSSCRTWKDSQIVYVEPCDVLLASGVRLVRLKYRHLLNGYITEKLRILEGIENVIEDFKPDVIRALNPHNFTLPKLVEYKKRNPQTKLYVDSHQDFGNAGIGFLSLEVFHKTLVKRMLHACLPYIDRVFYCQDSVKGFLKDVYNLPDGVLEFFPMGGVLFSAEQVAECRKTLKASLQIESDAVLLVHSGKMDKLKNTIELLHAFNSSAARHLHLLLVGSIYNDIKEEALSIIESNPNIHFLGWKSASELRNIMAGSRVYFQPGSASATIWQSVCCGNAIALSPNIKGYKYLMNDNGWYAASEEELRNVICTINQMSEEELDAMSQNSLDFAAKNLDYRVLANRIMRIE